MAPGRIKRLFLDLATFPALGVFHYCVASGWPPQRLLSASLLLLAYCGAVICLARRWDRPSYFDWAIGTYFAILTLLLASFPDLTAAGLEAYAVSGVYASLFSAAFFPPLLGLDPFTVHYAKRRAPREVWSDPVFARINSLMSRVWAGLFATAFVFSLYPSVITRLLVPAFLMLAFGMPFNAWFPDHYLKRLGLPSLAEQARSASLPPRPAFQTKHKPATAWAAVSGMPAVFNAQAARGLSALIVFEVSGAENFQAALEIENGTCRLLTSTERKPDLVVRTPADVWLGIARGEISGQEAFMKRRYEAKGDLGVLIRMGEIFSGRPPGKAEPESAGKP